MREACKCDVEELSEATPDGVPGVCALATEAGAATTAEKTFNEDQT